MKMTRGTAERLGKAPTAEAQAQVLEESMGVSTSGTSGWQSASGSSGTGSGNSRDLGGGAMTRKSSGGSEASAVANVRKPTSPLRFVVQPPTIDVQEQEKGRPEGQEEVEVEVKKGGPKVPPALGGSVLGGKTMMVEEPKELGELEEGEEDHEVGEPEEMKEVRSA